MDEREFIQRCLSNDKAAWDEFVNRYSRLIYNYIYHILHIKGMSPSSDFVEDIFQEIFLNLIEDNFCKLRQFEGRNNASLASWLRIITINFSLDYIKKTQKINVSSLDNELEVDNQITWKDALVDQQAIANEIVANKEQLDSLAECFEDLSSMDKYIVDMHIYRGLSIKELQVTLDISRTAMDMRKSRIMQRLRECFEDKGFKLEI